MLTHSHLARLFLLGIGGAGLYMAFSSSSGEELAIIPCPFRLVTDLECPGCGMTRSCLSLAQGEFVSAWNFHPFSFFLVALAVAVGFFSERTRSLWDRMSSFSRALCFIIPLALCLGRWVCRFFE
ncbi:MAG: DUF2752 domain-containing protein [Planctomycetota bacterium]|nr:DUF2752 domain-containing protein [Planctomycetota bacterium]